MSEWTVLVGHSEEEEGDSWIGHVEAENSREAAALALADCLMEYDYDAEHLCEWHIIAVFAGSHFDRHLRGATTSTIGPSRSSRTWGTATTRRRARR
jgi:hypothetical protein